MVTIKDKEKVSKLLGEIIFPVKLIFSDQEITDHFKLLTDCIYAFQDKEIKEKIEESIEHSRFQKNINEFNRANETINRTAIAFPISTIPTEVERKIRTFSIFIGSFNLGDQLESDDEDTFEQGRRELTDMLNYAKIFYTLLGKPAAESASEAVIRSQARTHLEYTLGRYQHKVKNEGVNVVARMESLWKKIEGKKQFVDIRGDMLELKREIERFSGTIHILNIATNGFQRKYLEEDPYCIIDVIAEAYCNAFQQFYIAGEVKEVKKLRISGTKNFRIPLLDMQIIYEGNGKIQSFENMITYLPSIKDVRFEVPKNAPNITPNYFNARHIIKDRSLLSKFKDTLPQKIILQSPFFEIFINAFNYMNKEDGQLKINVRIIKRIIENEKEIIVEVINPIHKEFEIDKATYERMESSAGIAANKLFFENIGGGFVLEFDKPNLKAIARTIINLSEMESIMTL